MLQSIVITASVLAFSFLISCSNKTETKAFTRQDISEVKAELTVKSKLDEAKEIVKAISEINNHNIRVTHAIKCSNFNLRQIEEIETKKMTREELDLSIMPLQKRLDSLSIFLTAEEKNELKTFNPILFNEIIDTGIVNRFINVQPRYSLK